MKVILTLRTLNCVDCVPSFVLIISIFFTIEPTNLKKSYSLIPKKHDQTFINLTNVLTFRLILELLCV